MKPDFLQVTEDLMAAFAKVQERDSLSGKKGVSGARLVATYGLTAHANDIAVDVIDLIRRQRFGSAMPLVRVVFECAAHSQWLVLHPEASGALLEEARRQQKAMARDMERADSFKHLADATMQAAISEPTDIPTLSARGLEKICSDIGGGDTSLYVMYRVLSGGAHSGTPLVERWIEEIAEPPFIAFRGVPSNEPARYNLLAGTLAVCLTWTNAAFDCMLRARPMARAIDKASRALETRPILGGGKLVLQ